MTAATLRPLPGFSFEVKAPVLTEVLPRMDVGVFAGFAARGPVNVAVPVEDAAQFAAVFGADAPLAWDADAGRMALGQLAPAVRAFFANGGRRCWILRLANAPRSNAFVVPGVVAVGRTHEIAPLSLLASSPGSWSDDIELGASLSSTRFGVREWTPAAHTIVLTGDSETALATGDLLRITWRDAGVVLYAGVAKVTAQDLGGGTVRRVGLSVQLADEVWFDIARTPVQTSGAISLAGGSVGASFVGTTEGSNPLANDMELALSGAVSVAPAVGQVLTCIFGTDTLLLTVRDVSREMSVSSSPPREVVVRGDGVWLGTTPPAASGSGKLDGTAIGVERLSLELWARAAGAAGTPLRVSQLGLAPGHPRHVELLPSDDLLFDPANDATAAAWTDGRAPRLPVSGRAGQSRAELEPTGAAPRLCIPLGVAAFADAFLPATIPSGAALARDGLVPFDERLFGDVELATSLASTLIADAEYLRYRDFDPREPTGVQRALSIEEATLIAVPDAALPGWIAMDKGSASAPDAPAVDDADPRDAPAFIDCGAVLGRGPWLEADAHDATATVLLHWVGPADTTEFVVEEATNRDWSGAIVVFRGEGNAAEIGPRLPGDYYYRVRGVGDHPTEWSNGLGVRLGADGLRMRRASEYRDDVLVAVHRMLLRICAARRDLMAVLSLPAHYREANAMAHVQAVRPVVSPKIVGSAIQPLTMGEADALSFGALYHGWLATSEDDGSVRAVAPDGAACGVIARRAVARGAWISPANELLKGVVALEQPASPERWLDLQQLQINTLRQSARGFMVMNADTLSLDDELRPISVRRLLILLRRASLRLGSTYVFEPNNDSFRRMVQRAFDALLGDLFQRGAFAGATASTAFQVRTDATLNTQQTIDDGRFVVELRVAPSRPMTFLTIRLVQSGERLTATEG